MTGVIRINREDFNKITEAGIRTAEFKFLEELVGQWLKKYPNDIETRFYMAKIKHLQLRDKEASAILQDILITDPEFLPAYDLAQQLDINENRKAICSAIHVLTGKTESIEEIYPWAVTLRAVRQAIRKRDYEHSEKLLRKIIAKEQQNLMAVVEHCRLSSLVDESKTLLQLTKIYHQRWPSCVQIDLFRAKALFENGKEADAVSLLHSCVGKDPAGIVVKRIWGVRHDFMSLWPKEQGIELDLQVPSNIAVALNWNQIGAGEQNAKVAKNEYRGVSRNDSEEKYTTPKPKKSRKGVANKNSVYVILSTRLGMEAKYGSKSAEVLISKMEELADIIRQKPSWDAQVYLPDDFGYADQFGLDNITSVDPWKIKLALTDLDVALKAKSKMIGAVLIVGGHEIVPFHRLPNPTDDSDEDVLSDNPYGTSSSNYLAPEWQVGRFPGERGNDAGLILEQLRHAIDYHKSTLTKSNIFSQAFSLLSGRITPAMLFRELFQKPKDFGYSAAVWRRSSMAAFRPIGTGSELRVSPEFDSDTIDIDNLMKAKCAYFNLHGMDSTPEWYGQKDYSEDVAGPDFPVAISVDTIPAMINNIDLIISEACYGGYIIDKTIDESMALKLISIGSQGLVASTCIAYGSVYTPLIGADLLSFIIWKYTKDGYSFGEALMQAKMALINVMTQRQGYLDGEDQKTLLSFVLYGDPLGNLEANIYLDKAPERNGSGLVVKAVSDKDGTLAKSTRIPQDVAANLNEVLKSYLPGLDNASMKVREHKIRVNKIINTAAGEKTQPSSQTLAQRTQIMYKQKTKVKRRTHEQFARVTLDENGKVIKLAVSR